MKIDLEYTKRILKYIEEHQRATIGNIVLQGAICIDNTDVNEVHKFVHHLNVLKDLSYIDCAARNCGYEIDTNGNIQGISIGIIRITASGHKALEAMENKSIWNSIQGKAKDIGIETLKQIPALALEYFKGQ